MEFKVRQKRPAPPPMPQRSLLKQVAGFSGEGLQRQKTVPAQYEEIYGHDAFWRFWKWRLTFVACFFLAAVDGMLTWKMR